MPLARSDVFYTKPAIGDSRGVTEPEGPMRASLGARCVPIVLLSVLVVVFLGARALPLGGRFIAGADVLDYHFWNLLFLRDQVFSGSLPLWNPHVYCGQPFLANPANFVLYPPVLLYLVLPLPWAFNVDLVFHLILAATGTFYLARAVTGSGSAALLAAVAFALGSNMVDRVAAGHLVLVHAAAWLPWILYFIERALAADRMRNLVLAGLLLGFQILSGYVQGNLYTVYFAGFYFLVRYLGQPGRLNLARLTGSLGALVVVPVIALGLAAVSLLPAWELLARSNRAVESYEFSTQGSFEPEYFFTFLLPRSVNSPLDVSLEFGCYVGILPIVLACIGGLWARNRRVVMAWLLMLLIAVTFVLGANTPIYRIYYWVLPMIAKTRVPGRMLLLLVLFVSILAGLGAQYLTENLEKKRHLKFLIISLPVLVLCLVGGALHFRLGLMSRAMIQTYVLGGLSFAALFALLGIQNRRIAGGTLVAVLFVDLYVVNSNSLPVIRYADVVSKLSYEEFIEKDPGDYRVLIPIGFSTGNMSLASRCDAFHCYNAGGYVPGALADIYTFLHVMADLPIPDLVQHAPSLKLFRTRTAFSSRILGIKYAVVNTGHGHGLATNPWHMPRATLVHRATILPRYTDHLAYLKDPGFDPLKTVLLESDYDGHARTLPDDAGEAVAQDTVTTVSYRPNRIDLRTFSASSSYLLLSELFYPGWTALVDGGRVPILRADYLLRAIPLSAGRHQVSVEFRPKSLKIGGAITLVTLAGLGTLWVMRRRRTRSLRVAGSSGPGT